MKKQMISIGAFSLLLTACASQWMKVDTVKATSGNPVFESWYPDPEGIIYDDIY